MLHNLLSQYLEDVETAILDLKRAYIEHYSEEILTHNRINLRIRVHKHLPDKVVSAKKNINY
jgi:hypothetical protein